MTAIENLLRKRQEDKSALLEIIDEYIDDREKVRQLCGCSWILEQIQIDNDK
jgi:hypothetical protein